MSMKSKNYIPFSFFFLTLLDILFSLSDPKIKKKC